MLLSMTGFGDARHQDKCLTVTVEVRTVNNRYLKITTKCPELYAALEGDIERVIREKVNRGTVSVSLRVERVGADSEYALNATALESYWHQLQQMAVRLQAPHVGNLGSLLVLPGVVADDVRRSVDLETDWLIIRPLVEAALEKLHAFRQEEGRSMQQDLLLNKRIISEQLEQVVGFAPQVVSEYRMRLLERVRSVLAESEVNVIENDLIREVSIYAERSDINEEIMRLKCHLEQFQTFCDEPASAGRKLEFLSQEMFREVNTIGSKANNVAIAHAVVEMKAAVEKIREVLQNVE